MGHAAGARVLRLLFLMLRHVTIAGHARHIGHAPVHAHGRCGGHCDGGIADRTVRQCRHGAVEQPGNYHCQDGKETHVINIGGSKAGANPGFFIIVPNPKLCLTINIAAVPDFDNEHDQAAILQVADNSVIADPITPIISQSRALQSIANLAAIMQGDETFLEKAPYSLTCLEIEFFDEFASRSRILNRPGHARIPRSLRPRLHRS